MAGRRRGLYLLGSRYQGDSSAVIPSGRPTLLTTGRQTGGDYSGTRSGLVNITTPGTVIENELITGQLRLNANDCTVRNCTINLTEALHDQPAIWQFSGSGGIFEYNTVTGYTPNQAGGAGPGSAGIAGGARIFGNQIRGFADCIKAGNDCHIEFNYGYEQAFGYINGNLGQPAHCDGLQFQGTTGAIIKNNVFIGPYKDGGFAGSEGTVESQVNGGIFLKTDSADCLDVLIEDNQVWGYGNNCYLYATAGRVVTATVINNVFGENGLYALYGPFTLQEFGDVNLVESGNVNELGEEVLAA